VSRHLTPNFTSGTRQAAMKSPQILITHLKPEFRQEVIRELRARGHRLRVLRDGDVLQL
jgi:fructose-1,6-bisphosphatase/sedoheptulose 1,7-bisphosphatase-like protein